MKIREIMTDNPKACTPKTDLAEAAILMWDNDCGVLPVVEENGKVIGLITDRDICMSAAMTGRSLSNIAVDEVTTRRVYSCTPEDNVQKALEIMHDQKVRRVPVVDNDGKLQGIISINDISLHARPTGDKKAEVTFDAAMKTYQAICSPRTTATPPESMSATA